MGVLGRIQASLAGSPLARPGPALRAPGLGNYRIDRGRLSLGRVRNRCRASHRFFLCDGYGHHLANSPPAFEGGLSVNALHRRTSTQSWPAAPIRFVRGSGTKLVRCPKVLLTAHSSREWRAFRMMR